jgi:opacity protein-like surface antigen
MLDGSRHKARKFVVGCVLGAIPLAVAGSSAAQAGEPWEVSTITYLWASGMKGDIATFPPLPPVHADISFGDILDNFKMGAMGILDARKGRFVMTGDFIYLDLSSGNKDVTIPDAQFSKAKLDNTNIISTLVAGYRVADASPTKFDVLAGLRINGVDTEVKLERPDGSSVKADNKETWVDPIIGARVRQPLGKDVALAAYGDIGGFGVSSDFTWQVAATLQYQVSDRITLTGGYRALGVDYDDNGYVYDVTVSGPLLGLAYRF